MKKNYFLILLLFFALFSNAQITVQGVPRSDIKQKITTQKQSKKGASTITFDDIKYWVGTGSNKAAFVVQWNDDKNSDALIWGFKWDGDATGEDMLKAIAKADHRFFTLLYQGTQFGSAIGGFGFDLNGKNTNGLYKDENVTYPYYPVSGIVNTTAYDFDQYTPIDAEDHWQSGWMSKGYWSYWVKDDIDSDFGYSGLGASSRALQNGSWDVWNFNPEFNTIDISTEFTPVDPYVNVGDFTKGYFVVNEEWFGHTNGSVNFVDNEGNINYRVYSAANSNQAFGATTQYGTIYGDKFYFISKQAADGGDSQYTPGGRLVVADALTMKKIAAFDNIGGGDGRSFIGVDENTGYIGASNGIFVFDIANMKVGDMITGTGGGSQYAGQIGNMIRTSKYVFAVKQNAGVLIIDPKNNTVIKTISGAFHSIAQAKDGSVWAIQNQKLVNINAVNFDVTEYAIPTTKYLGSWGAWNAGSFTYSNKENALYWINSINSFNSGTQIVKFDAASKTFNENFAAIPGQTDTYKQIPYGAALRIDPVSDELILNTTESGYGAHYQKNWIHTFSNSGTLISTKTLNDYYWFPAITVFPDNALPVLSTDLASEVSLSNNLVIDLKTVVSDQDNLSAAIVKKVKSISNTEIVAAEINADDELVLTPKASGNAAVVISFNSNGKIIEKTITVTTSTLGTDQFERIQVAIYPNPVSDYLNIKTQDELKGVIIYDVAGRAVNTVINNNQVDVSAFAKGLYIITISTDKGNFTHKFIKN